MPSWNGKSSILDWPPLLYDMLVLCNIHVQQPLQLPNAQRLNWVQPNPKPSIVHSDCGHARETAKCEQSMKFDSPAAD